MGKGTEKERLKRLIIELERIGGREKVALWRRTAELLSLIHISEPTRPY